ncbi:hypothetical protein LshimejAT787_1104970 [Lyophyllum shimeji]|uniref:Uncharacterized protein n=1 Tax=Lyophyllum shimeji TaxID=47721 RepID=A0A9P3PWD3_LYOSH|nr:hypothetical protein LshimejAT787_1104970 [Lyophyllum shimeji]
MTFSGSTLRNHLLHTEAYVGRPGWTSTVGWKADGKGHTLFENRAPEDGSPPPPAIGILLGQVSEDRLYVSPTGTHSSFSILAKAKFQFTLEQPLDPDLRLDWEPTLRNLEHIQNAIASTSEKQHMILRSGTARSLRISAPVFEEKDPGAPQPDDDDILSWPIPHQHQDALHALFDTHRVLPLIVYDEHEEYVPPQQVPAKLRGALLEVHCRFRHYHINPKNPAEKELDSFSAVVEQIIIRQKATPKTPSPYRQHFKNRKGPLKLNSERSTSRGEQPPIAPVASPITQPSASAPHGSTQRADATGCSSPSSASTLSGEGLEEPAPPNDKRKADNCLESPIRKRSTRGNVRQDQP